MVHPDDPYLCKIDLNWFLAKVLPVLQPCASVESNGCVLVQVGCRTFYATPNWSVLDQVDVEEINQCSETVGVGSFDFKLSEMIEACVSPTGIALRYLQGLLSVIDDLDR